MSFSRTCSQSYRVQSQPPSHESRNVKRESMHYHLIGICGTAMASLAGMLQARGHRVTGSDENVYPPMSTMLEGIGIGLMPGYDVTHLDPAPDCVVVGNAISRGNSRVETQFDHADIYDELDAVKLAFCRLMNLVPGTGRLIAGWDSPHVREVIASMGSKLFTEVETFGLGKEAKWQARDIDYSEGMVRFRVFRDGKEWGFFKTSLIGDFNVRNCLAAIIAADAWGIEVESIASALASFQSVRRRCEVRGEVNGITVIDDFAHHPTAVRETLAALRLKYADRRLVAVFEPRSRTSCHATFQDVYVAAFLPADYVIISQVFDAQRAAEMGGVLDIAKLIENIAAQNKPAFAISNVDEIVRSLAAELRSGDVVAIMSNGAFGGIHEKLLSALSAAVKA